MIHSPSEMSTPRWINIDDKPEIIAPAKVGAGSSTSLPWAKVNAWGLTALRSRRGGRVRPGGPRWGGLGLWLWLVRGEKRGGASGAV